MDIGNNIKKYRLKNKLTQKELAKKSGIAEITIRKMETEKSNPKLETLNKIARSLGVDIFDLLDLETYKGDPNEFGHFIFNEANEDLKKRNIEDIVNALKKIGYQIDVVAFENHVLLTYKNTYIEIPDYELLILEKENNNYLKYKFEELLKEIT